MARTLYIIILLRRPLTTTIITTLQSGERGQYTEIQMNSNVLILQPALFIGHIILKRTAFK